MSAPMCVDGCLVTPIGSQARSCVLIGIAEYDELACVTICHDTMTILRAWVALVLLKRDITLRNRPQEACSIVGVPEAEDPKKFRLTATMTAAAPRRTVPRPIVMFRRTPLHSTQVNPSPGVCPSAHTAQTSIKAGTHNERCKREKDDCAIS